MQHLKARLAKAQKHAQANQQQAQVKQKEIYDKKSKPTVFKTGDHVLVSNCVLRCPQGDPWQGPFPVVKVLGPLTYGIRCGVRKKIKHLHNNNLKEWHESAASCGLMEDPTELPEGDLPWFSQGRKAVQPQLNSTITPQQAKELEGLLSEFRGLFSLQPGHTPLVTHRIPTLPGQVVCTPLRPLSWMRWDAIDKEVSEMLALRVIVPSHSKWRSPIILVPKPDGNIRFCIDFRVVNRIAKFNAYPMPRTDVLLDQLGSAKILTSLELTNGYWQVPVAEDD